jgi:hypothetical protein
MWQLEQRAATHWHAFALDDMFIPRLHNTSQAGKPMQFVSSSQSSQHSAYDILSMIPSMPLIENSKPTRASFRETFLQDAMTHNLGTQNYLSK